ncbi:hydrogenase maturation peptidase HycI [Candidatus Bathyarchaeota archaeon]|nr:MAG: hydrogenase maturation peptidase HycI [Candidatus Bathyarchaeota archaeon]
MLMRCLSDWLRNYRRLVILGIGNPMRGDDRVGVEIVTLLRGRVPDKVKIIDCQTVPENFIGEIRRFSPSHVLMIDAAHFGGYPGEARLIKPEMISGISISTHNVPLSVLAEVIEKTVGAEVMLLAIQPRRIGFEEEMSVEARRSARKIAGVLLEVLSDEDI